MTITQTVSSRTEVSAVINWTSSATVDYLQFSTDGGTTFTNYNTADGKSGSLQIVGLTPGQTYSVVIKYRQKSNQTYTTGDTLSVTTYRYPSATAKAFTIGETVTFYLYNPLFRSVTVRIIVNSTTIKTLQTSAQTVEWAQSNADKAALYNQIPTSTQGTYYIETQYGTQYASDSSTFSANLEEAKPTYSNLSVLDTNTTATAITGDASKILRIVSTPQFTLVYAAKYGATVKRVDLYDGHSSISMTLSGTTATAIGSPPSQYDAQEITIQLTDTRGIVGTYKASYEVVNYVEPSAKITLSRKYSFYDESYLKAVAKFYAIGSNSATMTYSYKPVGASSWTASGSLTSGQTLTFTADNAYAWNVRVQIVDLFGSSNVYNLILPAGVPLMFFDDKLQSVGVNCLPNIRNNMQLNGNRVLTLADFVPEAITITNSADLDISNWVYRVYRTGNSVHCDIEFQLGAAKSNWTNIATGFPPAVVDWIDTASQWSSSYARPLRVRVDTSGRLAIRYGADGYYRISFSYPTNYLE